MELEREIKLLKEKIVLLEKIKELREAIAKVAPEKEYIYYPIYPSYPIPIQPYPTWQHGDYLVEPGLHRPDW